MKSILVFLGLLACTLASALPRHLPRVGSHKGSGRIVGGEIAPKNSLPYQLSVRLGPPDGRAHFCGAVLYKDDIAITAATCFYDESSPDSFTVVAGEHHRTQNMTDDGTEQYRRVTRIRIHPNYTYPDYYNDIAILKLNASFDLNAAVQPIALATSKEEPAGTIGTVSGWGTLAEDSNDLAPYLLKLDVPLVSDEECKMLYSDLRYEVSDTMLCAGVPEGGKDACGGDAGGPLTIGEGEDRRLHGIVSWGYGCARPNRPGVYTEVAYFVEWLEYISNITSAEPPTHPNVHVL